MSRPGEFKTPGKDRRESVGHCIVITVESSRIEDSCRHCGRLMLNPPWVTECLQCQQQGCSVRGARIARCYR